MDTRIIAIVAFVIAVIVLLILILWNRSVIELMVLTFTGIVAFTLVGLGVIILVVEVKHPDADTALLVNTMMSLVSGILGALLGLIAGKSANGNGKGIELDKRPDGSIGDLAAPP